MDSEVNYQQKKLPVYCVFYVVTVVHWQSELITIKCEEKSPRGKTTIIIIIIKSIIMHQKTQTTEKLQIG